MKQMAIKTRVAAISLLSDGGVHTIAEAKRKQILRHQWWERKVGVLLQGSWANM